MSPNVLPFPGMTTKLQSYPNRIRELRQQRKMTQAELGEKIGASAVHVGHLELGRREVSLSMLRTIARVFDVPTADLLSLEDNPLGASPRTRRLLGYFEQAEEPARQAIERVAESMVGYRADDANAIKPDWNKPSPAPANGSAIRTAGK